jgi:DNA repair protein RadC
MKDHNVELKDFINSSEISEVSVKYQNRSKSKTIVQSSQDAYNIFQALYDQDTIEFQEQFYMLLLNNANCVLGWIKISQGGTTGTVVDPRIIFILALKTNSKSFILCHNHPSGNSNPSEADIKLTRAIKDSGKLLEIHLLDHLILGQDGCFFSFADEGVI